MLVSHRSASISAEDRSEVTSELARRVEWLCRICPEDLRGAAAHEELAEFRPRIQESIEALKSIEQSRRLTEEGLAWRRALTLLLSPQW
jgi:hypothetical protein